MSDSQVLSWAAMYGKSCYAIGSSNEHAGITIFKLFKDIKEAKEAARIPSGLVVFEIKYPTALFWINEEGEFLP